MTIQDNPQRCALFIQRSPHMRPQRVEYLALLHVARTAFLLLPRRSTPTPSPLQQLGLSIFSPLEFCPQREFLPTQYRHVTKYSITVSILAGLHQKY